ncbi:MAG: hypothetical protein LBO20_10650, partial [Bifidobacteriaceae bacterium]|nr:hypothetical protein [Bifidobacteriaceae bacterium]
LSSADSRPESWRPQTREEFCEFLKSMSVMAADDKVGAGKLDAPGLLRSWAALLSAADRTGSDAGRKGQTHLSWGSLSDQVRAAVTAQ